MNDFREYSAAFLRHSANGANLSDDDLVLVAYNGLTDRIVKTNSKRGSKLVDELDYVNHVRHKIRDGKTMSSQDRRLITSICNKYGFI